MSIDLDNIKHNYSILEIARRLGIDVLNNNTCRCANPWHDDKNPSMSFHIPTNTFKCFSCGASGSNIDLVILVCGCDFKKAVEFITSEKIFDYQKNQSSKYIANRTLPKSTHENNSTTIDSIKTKLYKDFINLLENYKGEAIAYLINRGLDSSTINKHTVASLPHDYTSQLEILTTLRKNYSDEQLLESGLYKLSKKGNLYNTFFAHRLLIAYTKNSEVLSIQGRSIDNNEVRSKYIFLKGSSTTIFNIDILENLRADSSIIISEGVIDCLSWQALGFNALAIGSSTNIGKIGNDAIEKLKRFQIFVAGDSDKAGYQMNDKIQKLLDENNIIKYQSINLISIARIFNIQNAVNMKDINEILTNINFESNDLGSLGIVKYARYGFDRILFLGYGTVSAKEIDVLKTNDDLEILLKLKKAFDGDITLL